MKIHAAEFVKGVQHLDQRPRRQLPEIAFAGRSNVGKSSLINCLLNKKGLAQTSNTPGKTRLLNYYQVNERFYFVDLPGYGFAKISQENRTEWKNLIESYIESNQFLKGIVQLIDVRIGPQELDLEMSEWLNYLNRTFWVVATKADKLSRNELHQQEHFLEPIYQKFHPTRFLIFSSETRKGKEELWKEIGTALNRP